MSADENPCELHCVEKLIDFLHAEFDSFFCLAYESHPDVSDSVITEESAWNHCHALGSKQLF